MVLAACCAVLASVDHIFECAGAAGAERALVLLENSRDREDTLIEECFVSIGNATQLLGLGMKVTLCCDAVT
jgi:hypothetical protein